MLTRKGHHYYVRQRDSGDANRRDLFGEHEGSIALSNIERIDAVSEERKRGFTFMIVSKGGGRKFVITLEFVITLSTLELYQRSGSRR